MNVRPFEIDDRSLAVIITGNADGFTRDGANKAITRLGGKPVGSVSARTDLVIVGIGAGVSKMAKARQHNLPVLDQEAFCALVEAFDSGQWIRPEDWGLGVTLGVLAREFEEASDDAVGVEDIPAVPFAERHLVAKAVLPCNREGGVAAAEVRMTCTCGHAWAGARVDDPLACPAEAGAA